MENDKTTRDSRNLPHSFNDKPAIISDDGCEVWYHHGKLHRDNAPAIMFKSGVKCNFWYRYGKRHREDGPAAMWDNGTCEFWYEGDQYSFCNWVELCSLSEEEKIELALKYDNN